MFALLWPAIAVMLFTRLASPAPALLQLGREPSPLVYPKGGTDYILNGALGSVLFNEYGWGGYHIYRLYPATKVFIDGRGDLYGTEFVAAYVNAARAEPGWRRLLTHYGVTHAVVEKDGPLAAVLAEADDWELVYTGDVEAVFARLERPASSTRPPPRPAPRGRRTTMFTKHGGHHPPRLWAGPTG